MQAKTLFAGILATGILSAGTAFGATRTFDAATTGDWSLNTNWSDNTIPGAGDLAIIPSDSHVTFNMSSGNAVGAIQVAGTLDIADGFTLIVNGSFSTTSTVNGAIVLKDDESVLSFTSVNQTVSGSGAIRGENSDAQLRIQAGNTLTSKLLIEGALVVQSTSGSDATLMNYRTGMGLEGRIRANAHGTLELAPTLVLADFYGNSSYRPTYEALNYSDAVLHFNCQFAGDLVGDFTVDDDNDSDCPSMVFDVDVVTDGDVYFDDGILDARNASFAWDGGYAGAANPLIADSAAEGSCIAP